MGRKTDPEEQKRSERKEEGEKTEG